MRYITATLGMLALPMAVVAREPPAQPRTASAVIAADKAWSAAEERGDGAYVAWLLEPGYVSVGRDGKVHTRESIVAGANARKAQDAAANATRDAEWRVAHPYRTEVKLFGDTAIATFFSTKPDSGEPINSSDIFVYRAGHWHAIYSQHSDAGS